MSRGLARRSNTITHFADNLFDACAAKGAPVCVGIDPVYEKLPGELRADVPDGGPEHAGQRVAALVRFVEGVLDAVVPYVPCVKIQSACFERYLWPGVRAYFELVRKAGELGLIVIGDAKRGDIDVSAEHYVAGCLADRSFADLGDVPGPDALTLNAYLGADSLQPFVQYACGAGKGLFALVRTSNPGGDALQSLPLNDGRTIAEAVAQLVARAGGGADLVGASGYSLLGAVVGATKRQDMARLRALMPKQIFLVPGFGAQGGSADDVRDAFDRHGQGALITASRSVLYAYQQRSAPGSGDWRQAIAHAARQLREQIAAILPIAASR